MEIRLRLLSLPLLVGWLVVCLLGGGVNDVVGFDRIRM